MTKRINVLCEGPTEEQFVSKVLSKYFQEKNIVLTPRSLDGGFNYHRLKYEVIRWLNHEKSAFVTTLIDFYGRKGTYPGDDPNIQDPIKRVEAIESAIKIDIQQDEKTHNTKFIPYLQLHEFEALLFSDPEILEAWLCLDHVFPSHIFSQIRKGAASPEHINDHPETAPSKRIQKIVPGYDKVADGYIILDDIGLQKIRTDCAHFNGWITQLENI